MKATLVEVPPSRLAATPRRRVGRSELGPAIREALDRVWGALGPLKKAGLVKLGHNVMVYRHGDRESIEVEVGVEIIGDVEPIDGLELVDGPAGRAIHVEHRGPYHLLGRAHDAAIAYAREHQLGDGESWEVYGDWNPDPDQLITDVYRAVRGS